MHTANTRAAVEMGFLAITRAGLSPASVVQLRWTHQNKKRRHIAFFLFNI